jgi:CRP/FNR family transcriptional regulator
MSNDHIILNRLSFLEKELVEEMSQVGKMAQIDSNTIIIREGQYIKHLPIIMEGIVRVFSKFEDKELLLYYIRPEQSCIVSFDAAIYNRPSTIYAVTEAPSKILLIPSGSIKGWIAKYPRFNQLFFDLYHSRYIDLLDTINQLIFHTLDQRILKYLEEKTRIMKSDTINIRHHQIARDLGTAREVVTRIVKKLETEGKIEQSTSGIKLLAFGD